MKASPTVFEKLASELGLGQVETEFVFHPSRLWRVDYCWPEAKPPVILEIEGGAFKGKPCPVCGNRSGGRHNRGKGFLDDLRKYAEAVILGYRVIRCTPQQRDSGEILETLRRLV